MLLTHQNNKSIQKCFARLRNTIQATEDIQSNIADWCHEFSPGGGFCSHNSVEKNSADSPSDPISHSIADIYLYCARAVTFSSWNRICSEMSINTNMVP